MGLCIATPAAPAPAPQARTISVQEGSHDEQAKHITDSSKGKKDEENNNQSQVNPGTKMEGKAPLRQDEAFKKLQDYFDKTGKGINILKEFQADPDRFSKFQ